MSTENLSKDELIKELRKLYAEVDDLKKYKLALEAQDGLIRALLPMGQVAAGRIMLKSILLQIIKFSTEITEAQECSLFILDENGVVIESILARGPTIQEDKNVLIGTVLDKGLAGCVYRERQTVVISDTNYDRRWINLPGQPYVVQSAFCLPFVRGRIVLGILTLTHAEPNHFTPDMIKVMQISATAIALVLDNARLYMESAKQKSYNS